MEAASERAPLLSVTVLNYNYGHYLPTCLDSILSQTFTNFELILINDKSTDNSLEVIQPYLADPRIRFVNHEINKGSIYSLIEGAELSRGKYITVISADDWILEREAFEKQIKVMEQDDQISFVYTAFAFGDDEGNHAILPYSAPQKDSVRPGIDVFRELVLLDFIMHSGTIIRGTAYDLVGGYDLDFPFTADHKMWLVLCHTGRVAYISETLYAYRMHANNMSKSPSVVRTTYKELLALIDYSFSLLPLEQRVQLKGLRTKAIKENLTRPSILAVFNNRYKAGLLYFRYAVEIRPFHMLFQRAPLDLALRIFLGQRNFDRIKKLKDNLIVTT